MMVFWLVPSLLFMCAFFYHKRLGTFSQSSYQFVSIHDLSWFPDEIKKSNVSHFDILGDTTFITTLLILLTHLLLILLTTAVSYSLRSSCQTKLRIVSSRNYLITPLQLTGLVYYPFHHSMPQLGYQLLHPPNIGFYLEPSEFQVTIKWWLGIPVAQGQSCSQCNAALDAYGHRALCCKMWGDVVSRHNRFRLQRHLQ